MEKTNISTYVFRSDEIINIVLFGIGVTREDVSTYKDYSYSDGSYLRLRVSDHGLFLQNWYDANKRKREKGESVPKLFIGQNLAITFALNEDECKEKKISFPPKIKNVTKAQTANSNNIKPQFSVRHICYYSWKLTEEDVSSITTSLATCVGSGALYLEPIKDASKYIEWKDTSNLPPRKITNKSKPRKSG